ncbi:MAG: hypothetical protein ACFCUS_04495 [Rubrimonas sp.]|uniref:baeRF11 domain-containing protein n=1 Tax=Rubrimonas sp. TaxID=2036015 RepID=UPI002FDD8F61
MLPVDIPTRAQILALAAERSDACVSIYLETTPVSTEIEGARIAYGNLVRAAMGQLEAAGVDKRRLWPLAEQFDDLGEDAAFWSRQARSLTVLATPEHLWTFRLANRLGETAQVSDRFHLKPLLRAITHPHAAFVLALSENSARLIEVFSDMAPEEVAVPDMPKDAASFAGRASINDRAHFGRIVGTEGKKLRLRQYARGVDEAIRAAFPELGAPLILAANEPVAEIFRSVHSGAALVTEGFGGEIDRLTPLELAQRARPILDAAHASEIAALVDKRAQRENQGRATTDVSTAARAAARGAIETLMVDMDAVLPGAVDPESGAVSFAEGESAASYGVTDQIAMTALATGAQVLSVRAADLPEGAVLAATLRYAI